MEFSFNNESKCLSISVFPSSYPDRKTSMTETQTLRNYKRKKHFTTSN